MFQLRSVCLSACLAVFAIPRASIAQISASTDIIVGRVLGPDSTPLAGARVTIASIATRATRTVETGSDGRFAILFRDGGGRYRLSATFLGMRPADVTLQRHGNEDRLVVTIYMSGNAQQLSAVEVRGRVDAGLESAFAAGGNERTFSSQLLERLPVNPGDLFKSAALVPGVTATAASDTSRAAFSIAAQPSVQNNITVDGMTFLFGSLPQDAVRATRIILNAYDVSRGQFTGGQLVTTTKSGTSVFQGTANFTGRPSATQLAGDRRDAFAQKYAQGLLSAGAGGPIGGSNRVFYFASGEMESRADATPSLYTVFDPTLAKLGVAPDSLGRFYTALTSSGAERTNVSPLKRTSTSGSTLARVDVDIGETNQLMLRGDARAMREEGSRVSPYGIPNTGGARSSDGGGGMAMLSSVMGRFINEARAYSSWEREDSDPYVRAPAGVVTVASSLDQGQQVASLRFGGNAFLPRTSRSTLQEASNELSFLTDSGEHRIKAGVMINRERSEITGVNDRYGVFLYNSLTDLGNNTPSLYARTIAGSGHLVGTDNAALYISHGWRKTPALQVTYGLRVEASRLADSPEFNSLVGAAFNRQTRNFLAELRVYPRFGLSYLSGDDLTAPSGTFSFGFGEFRGRIPSHLLQYVNTNAGFENTDSSVVCVGSAIPSADWASYFADSLNIPTRCVGTSKLPIGAGAAPNIGIWGDGAGAPRVWRSALSVSRRILKRYSLGFDALYAHGIHNPAATDLNLVPVPLFTLGNEPRVVYAPRAAIIEPTGAVSLSGSRQYPFFGTAYELGAGVSSRTAQITLQLSGADQTIAGATLGYFNVGYTFTRSRDQSNGFPFSNSFATTAGDPRRKEWGTSDLERRHSFVVTGLVNLPRSLELGLIGRLLSGARYTPMVSGDVNGDGLRNDRAFVFSSAIPAAPGGDTGVVNGMRRLLATADARTRDCLSAQVGRIAGRNSCTTPWYPGLDLQLNWRPAGAFGGRLTFSLVAANAIAGVDALVHGRRMRGWGQPSMPDLYLLNVDAFDGATGNYKYTVNEHFGSPDASANPFRVPFQLGVQMRAQLGAATSPEIPRGLDDISERRTRPIEDIKARVYLGFPLPIKMTLAAADSLKLDLTDEQLARLRALNDSINAEADAVVGRIAIVLARAGANPDPSAVAPKLRESQDDALNVIRRSVTALQAILSPEQWALLPDRIRSPLQATPSPRPDRQQR